MSMQVCLFCFHSYAQAIEIFSKSLQNCISFSTNIHTYGGSLYWIFTFEIKKLS